MFYLRRLQKGYVLHSGTFDTYKVKIDFKTERNLKISTIDLQTAKSHSSHL